VNVRQLSSPKRKNMVEKGMKRNHRKETLISDISLPEHQVKSVRTENEGGGVYQGCPGKHIRLCISREEDEKLGLGVRDEEPKECQGNKNPNYSSDIFFLSKKIFFELDVL